MTKSTTTALLKTKKEIIERVERGKLSVKTGSALLGMTRQGLWKLRKNYRRHGRQALTGRKRGPKSWFRSHNRTPEWIEEKVGRLYLEYGVGLDTLVWIIEDNHLNELGGVELSRSTVYRILVRRRLLKRRTRKKENPHPNKYTKGYPGEEVQLDTTEPFGKGKGTMLNIIDDYSRWKVSFFYPRNNSRNTRDSFRHFLDSAPFPVQAVRVDNGAEFKKDFASFCRRNKIRLTRNPVHTPEHNGKVERLHRTVEEECLWRVPEDQQDRLEAVNYALAQHTLWYNTKRRHLGYKMKKRTPQQKIEDWIIDNQSPTKFTKEVNETLILYKPLLK
jgi:transposase InsO family protein